MNGVNMKKGIIFDMDGTLWDSAEGVAGSWTEVVKEEYPELPEITTEDIQSVMGKTMDVIAQILFPTLTADEQLELLDKCCIRENDYLAEHGGVLYPEVEETLAKLKENYNLYIVSNCQSGYIEAFLEYYDFEKYFEDIECYGNNELSKGENIKLIVERNNLDKAVYVGDIQGDYDATMEAGLPFIHASYGFGDIAEPVETIEKFSDLPQVVPLVLS